MRKEDDATAPPQQVQPNPNKPQPAQPEQPLQARGISPSSGPPPLPGRRGPGSSKSEPLDESARRVIEAQELVLHQTKLDLQNALAAKEEIHRKWKQETKDLNRLQTERNNKLDDDYFIAALQQLRYDIKNWAVQHFDGELKTTSFLSQMPADIQFVAADAKYYMQSPRQRPELVQSVLWLQSLTTIFQTQRFNAGLLGAGGDFGALKTVRNLLWPDIRGDDRMYEVESKEFHKWRALTTALVEAKVPQMAVEERVSKCADGIRKLLKPYVSLKNGEYETGLLRIVSKATQLDCELNKQRADFLVRMHKTPGQIGLLHSYQARSSFCEIDERQEGHKVYFCTTAALVKCGSSDGDNYDQQTVLVKSQVCLEPPDVAASQGTTRYATNPAGGDSGNGLKKDRSF